MICPACGGRVPDGSLTCPRCHETIDATQRISLSDAAWCPGCGALLPPGADVCPKCGSSVGPEEPEAAPARPTRDLDLPDIGATGELGEAEDAEETGVITRIESALPSVDDASSPVSRSDRMPRTRAFLLADLLAVLVVGGATVLITHPWDPSATRISATTPADTSMSGFPGFLETLVGQDGNRAGEAQTIEETLSDAHDSLGSLSSRVDESERLLRSDGVLSSTSSEDRAAGLEAARGISIEVSNLISDIGELDDGSEGVSEAVDHLETLGNWLRNRCDALTEAWQISADSADPSADAEAITQAMSAGSAFQRLFSQNYDAWDPAA